MNSSWMTIWARSDTKGAAKQVMTFFFLFEDIPILGGILLMHSGTKVNCTRNGGVLQKRKGEHLYCPVAPAKCV